MTSADAQWWLRMRCDLWPDGVADHLREIEEYFSGRMHEPLEVLIACDPDGEPLGFAELNIRNCVDGCATDRVGYLEGWYVVPQARRRGVGAALVKAAEDWARSQRCTEFGSDTEIDNDISAEAHRALGFIETGRVRCFRKAL